jgi:uncharacterized protein (PEP-CTERM system associated)
MTITTAKRPRLAPLAAASALLACASCHAADWKFTPSIGLTETWTDNVNLQSDALAKGQFVTESTPGFVLATNGPRLKLAASSQWHFFAYRDKTIPDIHDSQRQYQLDARATVLDELLFLDAAASGGPQGISAFGPQPGASNLYALGNRTEVNTWRISPYLRQRFGSNADLTLRYTRDGVDTGVRNLFGSSVGSNVNLDLASGKAWHTLGWGLTYSRQDLDNKLYGASSSQNAAANLRYRLSSTLSATASGGYDKFDYQALGGRTAGRSWTVGTIWTPSQRTTVQASAGRRYFGQTGSLLASLRSRRSVWSVSYSDDVTTSRQQFVLPAAIDTAAMLDRLFASSIPDPQARAEAVAAYMQTAGLPPTLANSVNYLSNRYMRQKQLQAGAVFRGPHGDLVLSAFDTARVALSQQQSDSELLGSQLRALNDDIRQRGLSSNWNYRLSSRTAGILALTATRSTSASTGMAGNDRLLRAGLTHRFDRQVAGALEVRHHDGSLGAGSGQRFRENAVAANISVQL